MIFQKKNLLKFHTGIIIMGCPIAQNLHWKEIYPTVPKTLPQGCGGGKYLKSKMSYVCTVVSLQI